MRGVCRDGGTSRPPLAQRPDPRPALAPSLPRQSPLLLSGPARPLWCALSNRRDRPRTPEVCDGHDRRPFDTDRRDSAHGVAPCPERRIVEGRQLRPGEGGADPCSGSAKGTSLTSGLYQRVGGGGGRGGRGRSMPARRRYTYQKGVPPLRRAIADYPQPHLLRPIIPVDNVVVTVGGMQAIALTMADADRPGRRGGGRPSLGMAELLLRPCGSAAACDVQVPRALDETRGWQCDLDRLFDACGPKPRPWFVNSPGNRRAGR